MNITAILDYLFFPFIKLNAYGFIPYPTLVFLGGLYGTFTFKGYARFFCIYFLCGGAYMLLKIVLGVYDY